MRLIGHLKDEPSAKTLGDYLVSVEIRNLIEPDSDGWGVWIYSEDQLEAGRQALSNFLSNPGDAKFVNASQNAAVVAAREEKASAEYQKRFRTSGELWVAVRIGPVTITLIALSVIVTLLGWNPPTSRFVNSLMISQYLFGFLPEVCHGQVWRLLTPIFIHFGVLHILFNMFFLRDLGSLIETRRGPFVFSVLVVVLGIGSNLVQYIHSGPEFGGISGVLCGLLGYAWVRGHCDPSSGLRLQPMTVAMMLGWIFLCLIDVVPNVANGTHVGGLVLGMLIGAIPLLGKVF